MRVISVALSVLFGLNAYGAKNWTLGTGFLNHNLYKWTQSETGSTSLLGEFYFLPVQLRAYFLTNGDWYFSPRLLYTPLARSASDKGSSSTILMISLPLTQNLSNDWDWSFGVTYFMYQIRGKDGTIQLNNGASTSTFYLPERSVTAKNIIFETGFGYEFETFVLGLDLLLISPLTTRRSVSFLATLNYKLGE